MAGTSQYGRRVIGDEEFERQQQIKKTRADIYGPRITDPNWKPRNAKDAPAAAAATAPAAGAKPPRQPNVLDILDGSIPKIREELAKITDVPTLTQLRVAETEGKTRQGALQALDERIIELTKPENTPPAAPASVDDVTTALEANPTAIDELLAAEFERVEGPRAAALRSLREVEMQRPAEIGGPRDEILTRIDAAL